MEGRKEEQVLPQESSRKRQQFSNDPYLLHDFTYIQNRNHNSSIARKKHIYDYLEPSKVEMDRTKFVQTGMLTANCDR